MIAQSVAGVLNDHVVLSTARENQQASTIVGTG
jgi:hypothetical protein